MRPAHLDFESPRKRKFDPTKSSKKSTNQTDQPNQTNHTNRDQPIPTTSTNTMCLDSPKSEKSGAEDKSEAEVGSGSGSVAEEEEANASGSVAEESGSGEAGEGSRSASRSSIGDGEWDWMFWCPPDYKETGTWPLFIKQVEKSVIKMYLRFRSPPLLNIDGGSFR